MNEVSWKLFAPLSIEGATLLIEHQDMPPGMAIRLGGAGGVVLKPQEAQELLLNLLTGESWVSSRLVWAAPRLHIGQKGYNLNERAKLALIEALQSLLIESQDVAVNPRQLRLQPPPAHPAQAPAHRLDKTQTHPFGLRKRYVGEGSY